MEAPAVAAAPSVSAVYTTTATTTTIPPQPPPNAPHSDSVDSSPRSRTTDTWDGAGDPLPPVPGGGKLRLLCSYGGHIVPRPHDRSLCYVGGDTRIVVVDRNVTLPELVNRFSKTLLNGRPFILKYQLPNEDLDSLITVSNEEDLDNMVDEYDRLIAGSSPAKPARIRLFLFPTKIDVAASMGPIVDGTSNSDDWFLNALNGAGVLQRGFSDPASVNCLLGLEENVGNSGHLDPNSKEDEKMGLSGGKRKLANQSNQDVHSVPDSPIIETTSSFGSTSSSPSLTNLPPIRVHLEEGGGGGEGARVLDQKTGIEDQFAQMGVSVQKQEEGFATLSSTPTAAPSSVVSGVMTGVSTAAVGEYVNRVVSDDERSDHCVPVGYEKSSHPHPVNMPSSQVQQKHMSGDLPSPNSVSSDSSFSNAISRQNPMAYQDPSGQIASGGNQLSANLIDPKMVVIDTGARVQQVSDSDYVLPHQYEHYQKQAMQQQLQQQQHQLQQQQTQPQQFIHAGTHYVQHHPTGAVPISYYPVYPSPQQFHHHPIDQRYPVYYVPAGQAQAYNLSVQQQPSFCEAANVVSSSRPQTPPNPTLVTSTTRTVPAQKVDMVQSGVYRTATTAPPQHVQMPSHQNQPQQFVGYSQIHYPPQSVPPANAANATHAYDLADPAHAQIYFTQPLAPKVATQYQTMAPAMALSDASGPLSSDSVKPQIRTSQAL